MDIFQVEIASRSGASAVRMQLDLQVAELVLWVAVERHHSSLSRITQLLSRAWISLGMAYWQLQVHS
jgi:hypothetical protein